MNSRNKNFLFYAREAGSLAYLLPVFEKFSQGVSLYCSDEALSYLKRRGIQNKVHSFLLNKEQAFTQIKEGLFDQLISSCTGRDEENEVIEHAKNNRLPIIMYFDVWDKLSERLKLNFVRPSKLLVVDQTVKEMALDLGLKDEEIFIVGQPAFEQYLSMKSEDGFGVAFIDQPVAKFYGKSLGFDERDCLKLFKNLVAKDYFGVSKMIYIPHPAGSSIQDTDIEDMEVIKNGQEAIQKVEVVTGMYSSLQVEAYLMGKKVATILPDGSKNYDPLSKRDLIPIIGNSNAEKIEWSKFDKNNFRETFKQSSQRVFKLISNSESL